MPRTKTHTNLSIIDEGRDYFPLHVNAHAIEDIDVSHNRISKLPPLQDFYPLLAVLRIQDNKLTTLPFSLAFLPLQILDVSKNEIVQCPSDWSGMPISEWLVRFYAPSNRLVVFPLCLLSCHNLRFIDLHGNMLHCLPDLSMLVNLEALDVSYNALAVFPKWLGNMTELRILNFTFNKLNICHLPAMPKLATVDLAENPIEVFTMPAKGLPMLKHLDLRFTPVFDAHSDAWWKNAASAATAAVLTEHGATLRLEEIPDVGNARIDGVQSLDADTPTTPAPKRIKV